MQLHAPVSWLKSRAAVLPKDSPPTLEDAHRIFRLARIERKIKAKYQSADIVSFSVFCERTLELALTSY
jgi:hypothetical protein